MVDKYSEELNRERELLTKLNPFNKPRSNRFSRDRDYNKKNRSIPFVNQKEKNGNYFHLILGSDFEDLEMEIRGLRYYKEIDRNGKEIMITKRIENHYLSEEGSEDLLLELKAHLSSDIKLGVLSREEFLITMDIIRKFLISYITNNLYKLGMDTEQKQRKSPTLIVMMLSRIRAVYSRSVAGMENQRSHGDIKLSGELDFQKDERFRMEDMKN